PTSAATSRRSRPRRGTQNAGKVTAAPQQRPRGEDGGLSDLSERTRFSNDGTPVRQPIPALRRLFMKLQPLADRLIVAVLEEEESTESGIVLPDTAKEKPQRGRVLAVGPGARNQDGKHIEMDVAEGDEIVFSKYGGTEIKLGADDVLILRESDVLAKVIGTREPAGAAA